MIGEKFNKMTKDNTVNPKDVDDLLQEVQRFASYQEIVDWNSKNMPPGSVPLQTRPVVGQPMPPLGMGPGPPGRLPPNLQPGGPLPPM